MCYFESIVLFEIDGNASHRGLKFQFLVQTAFTV